MSVNLHLLVVVQNNKRCAIQLLKLDTFCSKTFFSFSKIVHFMDNVGKCAIRRLRIPSWVTKAKSTHSEYVILISFTLQQWFHEQASVLRYTYLDCLVVLFVCLSTVCTVPLRATDNRAANLYQLSCVFHKYF